MCGSWRPPAWRPCDCVSVSPAAICVLGQSSAAPEAAMTRSSRDSRTFAANEVAQNLECLAHCRALPKLELCAHLNGSVRDSTLK